MKTSYVISATLAALLIVACVRTPHGALTVERETLLTVGNLYHLRTTSPGGATDPGTPAPFVKVRENGRGG
jgi:hypothetical protein